MGPNRWKDGKIYEELERMRLFGGGVMNHLVLVGKEQYGTSCGGQPINRNGLSYSRKQDFSGLIHIYCTFLTKHNLAPFYEL